MKTRNQITIFAVTLWIFTFVSFVFAAERSSGKDASAKEANAFAPVVHVADPNRMRIEGEQRFHANCGRCHAAPQKFPPRMMATVLRHMRVRALITDEDRRLILFYMTQ
jgi:cytochrome c5